MKKKEKMVIGWREWVTLDDLNLPPIKAKVDTGARTSSLHAYDLKFYKRLRKEFVSFKVHPVQKNTKKVVTCHSRILEYRKVKSSNGKSELRPVILTNVKLFDDEWPIELTLTNRDEMGFRMLLGRESIKNLFYVDPGKSFFGLKHAKTKGKKR